MRNGNTFFSAMWTNPVGKNTIEAKRGSKSKEGNKVMP